MIIIKNAYKDVEVIGTVEDISTFKNDADFFIAIGDNKVRQCIFNKINNQKCTIVTLIDPSSIISEDVSIGIGTIIMPGVIINSSSIIGEGCIINTSSSIDHDNAIGNFVHLSPGVRLAGNVKISDLCWIGIGAIIINNIVINEEIVLGAGAVLIEGIDKKGTYLGIPARIKKNK